MMTSKPSRYFVMTTMVALATVWLYIGWVMWYPYTPLVVHSIRILDADQKVMPGEYVTYEVDYTKTMDLSAVVTRSLVNGVEINMTPFVSNVSMSKGKARNVLLIPEFADPGIYTLNINYEYEVSHFPRRVVSVRAQSNSFEILPKPTNLQNHKEIQELRRMIQRDETILDRHREKSTYDKR